MDRQIDRYEKWRIDTYKDRRKEERKDIEVVPWCAPAWDQDKQWISATSLELQTLGRWTDIKQETIFPFISFSPFISSLIFLFFPVVPYLHLIYHLSFYSSICRALPPIYLSISLSYVSCRPLPRLWWISYLYCQLANWTGAIFSLGWCGVSVLWYGTLFP